MKQRTEHFWDTAFGVLVCALALVVPFVVDEKLVRLKLQAFEIGVFILVFFVGLRTAFDQPHPPQGLHRAFFGAVLLWLLINSGLWFLAPEKTLAQLELRRVSLAFGAFLAIQWGGLTLSWAKRFVFSWVLSATILSIYGVVQHSEGMARVFGTYGNPIFFAAYLVPSLFLTLASLSYVKKKSAQTFLFSCFALQLLALFLTKTRAAWIATVGSVFLYVVLRHGPKKIPAWVWMMVLLGGLGFGVLTQDTWKRDQGHLMIWRDTARMWLDKPVVGVGLGAFHTRFPDYAQDDLKSKWPKGQFIVNYAHNEYLQILSEGGVLLFVSFAAILVFFFLILWRSNRAPPAVWVALSATSLLIQNVFSVDMRFGISLATFFLLAGVYSVLVQAPAPQKETYAFPLGIRLTLAGVWGATLLFLVLPTLVKPYQAHRTFSKQVGFFDERVLDPAKSISDLEALAQDYPNEPAVLEKLAYVYAKEIKTPQGDLNRTMIQKASETYEKLIVVDPNRSAAYNNYGNVLYTSGQVEAALTQWKKAVHVKPDFIDVHLNLGKIHYTRGELKEATHHLEKVLEINPNNAEALVYLKRMVE